METNRRIEHLAGKALLNKRFRTRLLARPEEAAKEEGITLTAQEIQALQAVDPAWVEAWLDQFESMVNDLTDRLGNWKASFGPPEPPMEIPRKQE
jgi:hypothetical protein